MARRFLEATFEWAQRASFIYLLLGIFVLSLPRPEKVSVRRRWDTDKTQMEFQKISESLGRLGFDVTAEDIDDFLWPIARNYGFFIRKAREPYSWLMRRLGFFQSWRMFSQPNIRMTTILLVELDAGDARGFVPIFRPLSSEYNWRWKQFEHERMRKFVDKAVSKPRESRYAALGDWIAQRAAEDFPRAERVRMTALHGPIPPPERYLEGHGIKFRRVEPRVYELERFRP
ncbi:MAG: hypothetical protein ACFB9M_04420 [Myxococcota bacterium]